MLLRRWLLTLFSASPAATASRGPAEGSSTQEHPSPPMRESPRAEKLLGQVRTKLGRALPFVDLKPVIQSHSGSLKAENQLVLST